MQAAYRQLHAPLGAASAAVILMAQSGLKNPFAFWPVMPLARLLPRPGRPSVPACCLSSSGATKPFLPPVGLALPASLIASKFQANHHSHNDAKGHRRGRRTLSLSTFQVVRATCGSHEDSTVWTRAHLCPIS